MFRFVIPAQVGANNLFLSLFFLVRLFFDEGDGAIPGA
jgi:hypothetical protein